MSCDSISELNGLSNLKKFVIQAPANPGVYKMISANHEIIYIGKAKNIRNRIRSYVNFADLPKRLQLMVSMIHEVEFEATSNELEALFLEADLIARVKPRFNILLKEHKSYNYILVSKHEYPRITRIRGNEANLKDRCFGPYYSGHEVSVVLDCLASAFKARTCSDKAFSSRTRPCLKYHIKRCSAPCCGKIPKSDYNDNVKSITRFLEGHSAELQADLHKKMMQASDDRQYEKAAAYRDQVRLLTKIQSVQKIHIETSDSLDVIGLYCSTTECCVQISSYRDGILRDGKAYFIDINEDCLVEDGLIESALTEFIKQCYQSAIPPKFILVSHKPNEETLLRQFLSRKAGYSVNLQKPKRGNKQDLVTSAVMKAKERLVSKKQESKDDSVLLTSLAGILSIDTTKLNRIEIYDNSHIQGKFAYGAMVVYEAGKGFNKSEYRLFKIPEDQRDDYTMMADMLSRRFSKSANDFPDLVIVDGGKGQLSVAEKCLENAKSKAKIIAIAKGLKRNAGDETIFYNGEDLKVKKDSHLMFFLQRLRDEAHRFVISSHKKARGRSIKKSTLDNIPGIGIKRRRDILTYFGSVANISLASVADLSKVNGIGKELAGNIFKYIHKIDST